MTTLLSDHDLTHRKLDQTREDVRTLHPLLQFMDPEQDDLAQEFTEKLIALLMATQEQLESQAIVLNNLAKMAAISDRQMQAIKEDLRFLVGEPEVADNV